MPLICKKCSEFGLNFRATSIESPSNYIEGNPKGLIWIVGLNPSNDIGHTETRSLEEFKNFDPSCHSYFSVFKKVLPSLYNNWTSLNSTIAHTDLVKCFSRSFPPQTNLKNRKQSELKKGIVSNCKPYLIEQILKSKPKLLICNGSPVCWQMLENFPPEIDEDWRTITSYEAKLAGEGGEHRFWIVLSGFIGRIDDRNKIRLGREIEEIVNKLKIKL